MTTENTKDQSALPAPLAVASEPGRRPSCTGPGRLRSGPISRLVVAGSVSTEELKQFSIHQLGPLLLYPVVCAVDKDRLEFSF